jgi:outer membrane protein insertion porin family
MDGKIHILRFRWLFFGLAILCVGLVVSPRALWLNAAAGDAYDGEVDLTGDDKRLVDVVIEGNVTIPATAIAKFIKARAGRPLTERQINNDIKALYGTRWFFNVEPVVRPTKEGLVLIYRVLEKPVVRRVEYRGLKKIKQKELEELTGLKPGSPFEVSLNREAARRIESHLHEKGYANATVALMRGNKKDHRDVIFQIEEGYKIRVSGRDFEGNDFFHSGLLKTKLTTKSAILWMFGGLYDPATIPEDIAALKSYYHSLGFFDVEITHKEKFNKKKDRVRIQYNIKEGPRFKIRNLVIQGNEVISEDVLRGLMKLVPGEYFNARYLAKDVNAVTNEYDELGRIRAIINAAPKFLDESGIADLVYEIDEDAVYRIRRIDVVIGGDNPRTKRTVVLNRLLVRPGDLASRRKILMSKSRLGGQLFESAITNPEKGPRISITPVTSEGSPLSPQTVRLQNDSSEFLPRSFFGRNPFQNETHRQPNFVQPYPTRPGEDESRIDETFRASGHSLPDEKNPNSYAFTDDGTEIIGRDDDPLPFGDTPNSAFYIQNPSYLRSAETVRAQNYEDGILQPGNPAYGGSPQGDPFAPGLREPPPKWLDLQVNVEEARTGRLMFGVGVNSDAGVLGSIVLSEQNFDILRPPTGLHDLGSAFRGGGQRFRAEAIPGNVVSRYAINWVDPYFLDTDFSLSVSGFFYNRFFDDWDEQRGGGRVSVGYQLTPQTSVTGTIRLEEVVIDNPDFPTPPLLFQSLGSNVLNTFRVAGTHDTRDSQFFPGEGHFVELAYEQAFGEFVYPRFEASARQYFTVYSRPDGGGRHILTLAGQLGWTDEGTPIFERFFAGGFQSFRGFDFRGVGPRQFGVTTGGRWMTVGTVEYQIPIMPNESIQAVVFSDFGTVENDVGFENFRVTVGTGLRITVPGMGPVPLAFDFAFPVMSEDFDDERVFSFYVDFNQ